MTKAQQQARLTQRLQAAGIKNPDPSKVKKSSKKTVVPYGDQRVKISEDELYIHWKQGNSYFATAKGNEFNW